MTYKAIFVVVPVIALLLGVIPIAAHASIFGNLGSGWDAGKIAARQALNFGQTYDASCPSGYSDSWCVEYHGGYFEEWSSLRGAQQ